jgi:hypothetical protein
MLADRKAKAASGDDEDASGDVVSSPGGKSDVDLLIQPDALIHVRQLAGSGGSDGGDLGVGGDGDMAAAVSGGGGGGDAPFSSKLQKVHQLTGFADAVYAEGTLVGNESSCDTISCFS